MHRKKSSISDSDISPYFKSADQGRLAQLKIMIQSVADDFSVAKKALQTKERQFTSEYFTLANFTPNLSKNLQFTFGSQAYTSIEILENITELDINTVLRQLEELENQQREKIKAHFIAIEEMKNAIPDSIRLGHKEKINKTIADLKTAFTEAAQKFKKKYNKEWNVKPNSSIFKNENLEQLEHEIQTVLNNCIEHDPATVPFIKECLLEFSKKNIHIHFNVTKEGILNKTKAMSLKLDKELTDEKAIENNIKIQNQVLSEYNQQSLQAINADYELALRNHAQNVARTVSLIKASTRQLSIAHEETIQQTESEAKRKYNYLKEQARELQHDYSSMNDTFNRIQELSTQAEKLYQSTDV